MSKFFNIRQSSCLFMIVMLALALLLSACPGGDDDDSGTSGGTPNAPTCPVDDTCISIFEATSELNKANLTVTNKLGTALPLAFNVRVHVVPKGTNTVAESDDYPIARGTATIDGNTPPLFSAGLGLSWTLVDTALANNASETAIIEVVTETLDPGERLIACIYANSDIGATDIPPIVCKKLDSVDLVMSDTDSDTSLTVGLDPTSPDGLGPSTSGGVFSLNAGIKNAGTLDYVAPTDAAEITGIDVYRNTDAAHTTYPAATARADKKIDNAVDTDHLTSDIVSGAIYETNVAFQDPFYIENRHSRKVYACVARVAKEFYVHNNCHFPIIDLMSFDGTPPDGTPNAPTCPVDDTACIPTFEATSELNKANLTVLNKLGTALPLAYNVRVHVVPKGTNTLINSDTYPAAKGTVTIDGNTPPSFSSGAGLNWTLVDTALANNASETAIIKVTTTLDPGERLIACIYANNDIGATAVVPSGCKKLDSVDLVMSATDSNTGLVQGLDPDTPGGLGPSTSGGLFYLNAKLKNAGKLEYVPPTVVTEITGIDVYLNTGRLPHTTYPTETARANKKIDNKVDTDHLTANIASGATYETNVVFQDTYYWGGILSREVYACVARVAKEFYIHNNCHFPIINLNFSLN